MKLYAAHLGALEAVAADRLVGRVWAAATPYDAAFVSSIKEEISPRYRAWVPEAKLWVVSALAHQTLRAILEECFASRLCRACFDDAAGAGCSRWAAAAAGAVEAGYRMPKATADEPPPPKPPMPPSVREAAAFFGLAPPFDPTAVHRAFARLALKYHPDTGGSDADMIRVLAAREVLMRAAHAAEAQR